MAADDYEDLFSNAPFGYLATAMDGTIARVNRTLLGWLKRDVGDVIGRDFGELLDPGSRLFYETRHRPTLLLSTVVDEVGLTLLRGDGTPLPVLVNARVVAHRDGTPAGIRIGVLDAAQRHELEATLLRARRAAEESETRSRVLQSAGAAFAAATGEIELAQRLVESAIAAFDAATATVLFPDDAGRLGTVAGAPRSPLPGGPIRVAFETRSAVVVPSMDEAERRYPAFVEPMRARRIDAITAVPLLDGELALGVLVCTFGRARRFDDDAIALQTALALQAGQVLVRLRLQAELQRIALHDPLTGLANRQLLHDRAEYARGAAARSARPLALLFFDLDGFKPINDRHGHQTGDAVLHEIAERLHGAVRAIDFAARFGGDEFVVVCEDADEESAAMIAERVRAAVARPLRSVDAPLSASVGVAVLRGEDAARVTTDELLEQADAAMYRSKQSGGDRVTVRAVP